MDTEFVWRIEDILDLNTESDDPLRPLNCFDEYEYQLVAEKHLPLPLQSSKLAPNSNIFTHQYPDGGVLVTGNNGYIGMILVPMLISAGYKFVGLDSDLYQCSTFGAQTPEVITIRKEFLDIEAREVNTFDVIMHLPTSYNDPLSTLK